MKVYKCLYINMILFFYINSQWITYKNIFNKIAKKESKKKQKIFTKYLEKSYQLFYKIVSYNLVCFRAIEYGIREPIGVVIR